jgi:hypothetical protein
VYRSHGLSAVEKGIMLAQGSPSPQATELRAKEVEASGLPLLEAKAGYMEASTDINIRNPSSIAEPPVLTQPQLGLTYA